MLALSSSEVRVDPVGQSTGFNAALL